MNKPVQHPPSVDDDIGPLDEHGQQIWSPEEEAAMARLHADPRYAAAIKQADEDCRTDDYVTHEEMLAISAEQRRRWFEERGEIDPKA